MRPTSSDRRTGRIAAAGSLVLALTALAPTSSATAWTAATMPTGEATADRFRAGDGDGADVDLRETGVFTMTNARSQNRVVALAMVNGGLRKVGSFATCGTGSGGFEDTANGLVLSSSRGESAPNNLIGDRELLFATNAGSNNVSVLRVRKDRLQRVEVQHSRGMKPVSVTVNRGLVYVLNSGEVRDGLPTHPNCTPGGVLRSPASG